MILLYWEIKLRKKERKKMKINSSVVVVYVLFTLIPISYCIYLDAEIKNALQDYESLQSKAFVLNDKAAQYEEESANYNTGYHDGYEQSKNEEKLQKWQSSILTKGYENGIIKCYYVSKNGKQIEFPLKEWLHVEFQLNKWIP